ncbi:MAG: class II fructose-bisphosphate aldolase [Fimbriimonadaceae bacterium]|nr:class II fructose-bisphosphate aldolase [Fimbriimonadaceae bacterium]
MPVPDAKTFNRMLDACLAGDYALASINVASTSQANAALAAFAESKTDGIIQLSTGGAEFGSGPVKDMVLGAEAIAQHIHLVASRLPVYVAITTDHCVPAKVDKFVRPLLALARDRKAKGLPLLFNGHMFDGSELPLKENLAIATGLAKECAELGIVLEVETGVVGGEEDGIDNTGVGKEKLYTTPEDMVAVYEALSPIGRFTLAATFGNVHGVYKPGNVKLKPTILRDGQDAVVAKHGPSAKMPLVFHGGSGTPLHEIQETLAYGVVKMNVDTDCQYAYTRPIADHVFTNYSGVLRVDGEMGDKKTYDPRSYLKKAEASMKARVLQACEELKSLGVSLCGA